MKNPSLAISWEKFQGGVIILSPGAVKIIDQLQTDMILQKYSSLS
jgi:hypothetical protein